MSHNPICECGECLANRLNPTWIARVAQATAEPPVIGRAHDPDHGRVDMSPDHAPLPMEVVGCKVVQAVIVVQDQGALYHALVLLNAFTHEQYLIWWERNAQLPHWHVHQIADGSPGPV